MAGAQDIFDQYLGVTANTEIKKEAVASASSVKKSTLPTPPQAPDMYQVAAAVRTGNGRYSADEVEKDLINLNPLELNLKYGAQEADRLNSTLQGGLRDYDRDTSGNRTDAQVTGDTLSGAVSGFGNSVLGIGALGLGLVNDDAGVWAARGLQKLNEKIQGVQSDELNASRKANAASNALSGRDNEKRFQEDKKTDGEFVSSLKRFGRDAVSTVSNLDDPALIGDTVSSGVGSLLAGGPIAKGLKALGKVTVGRVVKNAAVAKLASAAAMPTAIGLMEGGGAYQQGAAQAYDELMARTDLTEDQKIEMANRAGLIAGAIQAPTAAVISRLTGASKFEAAPLRVPSIGSAVGNLGRETTEEAIQSATGQLSQNVGQAYEVNPDQELSQGVGEQAVMGAIGGLGAAGAVQAPGAALRATVETAKLPFKGVAYVGKAAGNAVKGVLTARGERVIAENEAKADSIISEINSQALAQVDDIANTTIDEINSSDVPEPDKLAVTGYIDRIKSMLQVDGSKLEDVNVPQVVKDTLAVASDKFDALKRLASVATEKGRSAFDRLNATKALNDMVNDHIDLQNAESPEALSNVAPETLDGVGALRDAVANLGASKSVQRALKIGRDTFAKAAGRISSVPITEEMLSTPEGVQQVDLAIGLAEMAPEKSNPEQIKQILFQDQQGKITLSPAQRMALRASSALVQANMDANQKAVEQFGLTEVDRVSAEIQFADGDVDTVKKSAKTHMQGIVDAYRSGDKDLAAQRLTELRRFAQHMGNKVLALNEALATGKTNDRNSVRYQALTPGGKFRPSLTGLYVNPYSAGSIRQAQKIAIEAETVAAVANNLSDIFPDLNIEHVNIVPLDEGLSGSAEQVQNDYRSGSRKVPSAKTDEASNETNGKNVNSPLEQNNTESVAENPQTKEVSEPVKTEQVVEQPVEKIDPVAEEIPVIEPKEKEIPTENISVETEVVPEAETPKPVVKGIKGVYPNLLAGASNLFHKAFRLPNDPKTRIIGVETPLAFIGEKLRSATALRKHVGSDLKRGFSEQIADAYNGYLGYGYRLAEVMEKRLAAFMNEPYRGANNKDKSLMIEHINDGINSFRRGMAINIAEQNEDGSVSYNQELKEAAVLAALQWFLKLNQYGSNLDNQAVSAITGIPLDQSAILEKIGDRLNIGMGVTEMVRSLARDIERFWGLQVDNNQPRNYSEGIYEAIAKEIIESMISLKAFKDADGNDVGLITQVAVELDERDGLSEGEFRTVNRFIPISLGADNALKGFPTAIETAVLTEPEELNYLDELPPVGSNTQLRNNKVPLTDQQLKAKQSEQEVPHYLDMNFVTFLRQLGEDGVMLLFGGGGRTEKRVLNKNHKRSLDGQNLTAQSAYLSLNDLLMEIENKAALMGVEVDQVPIRFGYDFTVVNRLQMAGKNNPQANKIMRHAMLPTRATIDLTNANEREKFMMGIAQALGVKVHEKTRSVSLELVQEKLSGVFAPAVEFFKNNTGTQISEADLKILSSLGLDPTMSYALMEYSRSGIGENNPSSSFTTSTYFEADGVANGVTNAMALFPSMKFSFSWFKNIAKGGFLVGKSNMTLADQRASDAADLYKAAANITTQGLLNLRNKYASNRNIRTQLDAVKEILDLMLPGAEIRDGKLIIDRGATKNPLTITLYGSGAKGIAGNITSEVVEAIYEKMSVAAQAMTDSPGISFAQALFGADPASAQILFDRFSASIKTLTSTGMYEEKGVIKTFRNKEASGSKGNLVDYTFSKADINTLQANILHGFISPLRSAILETVGEDLDANTKLIRQQIQAWSLYGMFAYQRAYAEVHAERMAKDPSFKASDLLSKNDEDKVYEKTKDLIPFVSTPTQNFMMGGKQSLEISKAAMGQKGEGDKDFQFGQSLTGSLESSAFVYSPGDASVSGIPFMTIGTGDGQTIQNLATEIADVPKGHLFIYDGVHSSVTDMDTMGEKANEAVFNAWKGNPLKAVSDGFAKFVSNIPQLDLTDVERKRLIRAIFPEEMWESDISEARILKRMKVLSEKAAEASLGAEARHIVLQAVNSSTDQMAGAGKPYVHKGIVDLSEMSDGEMEATLNKLYEAVLTKLKAGEQVELVEETPSETEPKEIQGPALSEIVDGVKTDRRTKMLMRDIVKSMAADGYKIVSATKSQIYDLLVGAGMSQSDAKSRSTSSGFTIPGAKTIYMIEGQSTPETMLHEMFHAATFDKVLAHYNGTKLDQAVVRIEALMAQFKTLNDPSEAYQNAMDEMSRRASKVSDSLAVRQAAELNEFMAWALANADLANLLKTTKVESPLVRLSRAVIKSIKTLLWGAERSVTVSSDMFSNLRFNTNILMRSEATPSQYLGALFQDTGDGRLDNILSNIKSKLVDYISPDAFNASVDKDRLNAGLSRSARVANTFIANGFPMTGKQYTTFLNLMTIMGTSMELDANATGRIQEIYSHVIKDLSVESFMADPTNDDQRPLAQNKFNVIMGRFTDQKDLMGRSTLLPAFLAISMVSDEFREILNKTAIPKGTYAKNTSLDMILDNVGEGLMSTVSRAMSGEGVTSKNMKEALDNLTQSMLKLSEDRQLGIEDYTKPIGNIFEAGNDFVVEGMNVLGKAAVKLGDDINAKTNNAYASTMAEVVKLSGLLISEEAGKQVSEGWVSFANKYDLMKPLRELLVDLVGRTESNKDVYDMIKSARAWAQQIRQQFREKLPEILNKQFTKEVSQEEWAAMTKGIAQTDLASLLTGYSMAEALEFLNDSSKVSAEIAKLEDIVSSSSKHGPLVITKAKQLARYMNTKVTGGNLLTNAEAVTNLLGENASDMDTSAATVKAVDHLITLYAVQGLDAATLGSLSSLVQNENEGISFVTSYMVGQRTDELKKAQGNAKFNHYKGHISLEQDGNMSLIIAPVSRRTKLFEKSYSYVGPYVGSNRESSLTNEPLAYFVAKVPSRAGFAQGIMQNVQQTVSGVDMITGFSTELNGGQITSPEAVARIRRHGKETNNENLVPRFDKDGKVYAYERSVDPRKLQMVNRKTDLAKAIGIWAGRQAEEASAFEVNKALIDNLKAMYDEAKLSDRTDEFIDAFATNDKVISDALNIMNTPAMDYVRQVFGKKFMVRKDMFNDALGYRSASIGDVWTGTSRWSPETQENIKKMLLGVFGNKAYQYVVNGEKLLQNVISDARVTIVVRSVIVPAYNIMANVLQLMTRGVPAVDIFKAVPKKTAEIEVYVKNRLRLIEAEAELRASSDPIMNRRLTSEIQSIKDSYTRLSIWPLLQAGEFSSVSDAGTHEDVLLAEGKLSEYLDQAVRKLPAGLKTAAQYATVSKDTALYRALLKTVEYGDFIAKAIIYDDLTKRQGKSKEYALGRVTEEFVNYDRLPGRTRGYLESIGLLWFWNFKIRSTKVAISMVRNNPVHSILAMTMPAHMGLIKIGLPLDDNFWGVLYDGRLGRSIGPDMGIRAPGLLPISQLLF